MKILHILSQMPDFTGSGKTLQAIIKQAEIKGHDNFMVAGIQNDFQPDPNLIHLNHAIFVRFNGIDLNFPLPGMSDVMPYKSTVFSGMTSESLAQYQRAFKHKIELAKERFNPDIIHTHHLWIASKIAREVFAERPVVTSCHGTCLRQYSLCPEIGTQITGAVKKMDRIFCLSRHQKNQVQQIHGIAPEKIKITGAGFDQNLFNFNAKSDTKKNKGPVEILYAGKLSRAKGVPWLLRSLQTLPHLNFRLHLAGSGSGMEKEACLALAWALGDRVILHGALSHNDLACVMRKAHLFVLPSFFEGLPLVIMEALASGCRILTTALPGTREILKDTQSDMVDLIELPELKNIDTPFEKDIPLLEQRLSQGLENSIKIILSSRQPDIRWAKDITHEYTWEKVFSRMEDAYHCHGTVF
ncbi:Glycosyltransferase involved in cell wall bisynthesis [Desulfocicer vacuolatum DSM 3385]|uniref:Glycosyltransferase involved in cell wall bisynthesis n=1 Tax=Desulfocicer vacuolatum DSM 3385 TaxID=1121400 RepID=A0A1W2EKI7_9BACT|nr:glycosyltransferase family 4 protein [Desulfocicer vacuolatum]SMD10207.1 Glycosyltransferase involved in cell wall bisynthesis [Desulfocicer vacuolatum DSM 3385]